MTHCILIGAPVDSGQQRPGCLMGPAAYRVARLADTLAALGHSVEDRGDLTHGEIGAETAANPAVHHLPETLGWTRELARAGREACRAGMPIFLGGDHSLSLGSVAGVAQHAAELGRPLFVLWLGASSVCLAHEMKGLEISWRTPWASSGLLVVKRTTMASQRSLI